MKECVHRSRILLIRALPTKANRGVILKRKKMKYEMEHGVPFMFSVLVYACQVIEYSKGNLSYRGKANVRRTDACTTKCPRRLATGAYR